MDVALPGDSYPDRRGAKYTGSRPAAEIAKDVRSDIAAAIRGGHLPASVGGRKLKYSVRSSTFAGGQAIDVTIKGMADDDSLGPVDASGHLPPSEGARDLVQRVERIAGAYNRSRTDSMSDYFNETYYCGVQIQSEAGAIGELQEKLQADTRRKIRAASTSEELDAIREHFRFTMAMYEDSYGRVLARNAARRRCEDPS